MTAIMDAPDTTAALAPGGWDEYIGQGPLKNRLELALDSAVAGKRPLDHVFLAGPAGYGKTTIARILADDIGAELLEFNQPMTRRQIQSVLVNNADAKHDIIILCDELHAWKQDAQEVLYPVVLERTYDGGWGPEPCPRLTIIGATTEKNKVMKPLRDRFHIQPTFVDYEQADMEAIVAGMATRVRVNDDLIGIDLDTDQIAAIASAAGGTPRVANMLITTAAELVATRRPIELDLLFELCQVEPDGLTTMQVRLLRVLYDNGGIAGLEQLSSRLDIPTSDVRALERPLAERRMLIASHTGRQLTGIGRARIR